MDDSAPNRTHGPGADRADHFQIASLTSNPGVGDFCGEAMNCQSASAADVAGMRDERGVLRHRILQLMRRSTPSGRMTRIPRETEQYRFAIVEARAISLGIAVKLGESDCKNLTVSGTIDLFRRVPRPVRVRSLLELGEGQLLVRPRPRVTASHTS